MRPRGWALLLALLGLWPGASSAQWRPEAPRAQALPSQSAPAPVGAATLVAPALSLVVPGAGQHVLGQSRKWAYLGLEIAAWAFFVERRRAGAHYRDRYRDFAWENGRIQTGARVDGDFGYYEKLTQWTRSGAFDRDGATSGVQPELDGGTYNGSVWQLATRIYLVGPNAPETDPAYQSALAYYGARAYGAELLWDWTGAPGAQSEFSSLVDLSDGRFRQATTVLGVVIANHLLASVDAYVSSRSPVPLRVRVVPSDAGMASWGVTLTVEAGP